MRSCLQKYGISANDPTLLGVTLRKASIYLILS